MSEAALVCANHPERETGLRCNRCAKPICAECAVLTPVGYRCKQCVRSQQSIFETAYKRDFLVAALISGLGVALAIALLRLIGFWGLLLAPVAGGGLAEIVRKGVGRRRSKYLPMLAAIGAGLGILPHVALPLFVLVASLFDASLEGAGLAGFTALWPLAYGALMISALFARLKGIRL